MSPCKTLRVVLVILTALTGIVVIRRPCDTVLVLVLAIGIWMVPRRVLDPRALFDPSGHRVSRLAGGLIGITLGVVILSLPDESVATPAVLVGIAFVVRGLLTVVAGIRLRGVGQETPEVPAVVEAPAARVIRSG